MNIAIKNIWTEFSSPPACRLYIHYKKKNSSAFGNTSYNIWKKAQIFQIFLVLTLQCKM